MRVKEGMQPMLYLQTFAIKIRKISLLASAWIYFLTSRLRQGPSVGSLRSCLLSSISQGRHENTNPQGSHKNTRNY